MAFSRKVFDAGVRFPESVGGIKGERLHGEEQFVCFEISRKLGKRILYLPTSTVLHKVRQSRLNPRYFVRNAYYMGASRRLLKSLYRHEDSLKLDRSLALQMISEGIVRSLTMIPKSPWIAFRRVSLTLVVLMSALAGYLCFHPAATRIGPADRVAYHPEESLSSGFESYLI